MPAIFGLSVNKLSISPIVSPRPNKPHTSSCAHLTSGDIGMYIFTLVENYASNIRPDIGSDLIYKLSLYR